MHFDLLETLLYGAEALMYLICGIIFLKLRTESQKKFATAFAVVCFAAGGAAVNLIMTCLTTVDQQYRHRPKSCSRVKQVSCIQYAYIVLYFCSVK